MTQTRRILGMTAALATAALVFSIASLQAQTTQKQSGSGKPNTTPAPTPAPLPPSFIIGPDDVLTVNVWNAKEVSGDVVVRPDGKITLPVGNDIVASGLTVDELKEKVTTELKRGFYDDPTVFIQVKTINSRTVSITGMVNKPGRYPLTGPMTVVQLISAAGGLLEFADQKHIVLISGSLKAKDGQPMSFQINYKELLQRKNLSKNNPELRPGDSIIVP